MLFKLPISHCQISCLSRDKLEAKKQRRTSQKIISTYTFTQYFTISVQTSQRMKPLIYSVIFCCFFALNHGFFGKTFRKFQDLVKEQRRQRFLQNGFGEVEGYAFDQRVDHFEIRMKPRKFEQRYWRNKVYWRQPNGPVFLYVGGEAGLDGTEIYGGKNIQIY